MKLKRVFEVEVTLKHENTIEVLLVKLESIGKMVSQILNSIFKV